MKPFNYMTCIPIRKNGKWTRKKILVRSHARWDPEVRDWLVVFGDTDHQKAARIIKENADDFVRQERFKGAGFRLLIDWLRENGFQP